MKITMPAVGLLALALAACGSSGSSSRAGTTSTPVTSQGTDASPTASATGTSTAMIVKDFKLEPGDITVRGAVALGVTNQGPTIHNVSIRDAAGKVVGATKDLKTGESESLVVDIPAGSYIFFCSLPGHESLGIKGTLTVAK